MEQNTVIRNFSIGSLLGFLLLFSTWVKAQEQVHVVSSNSKFLAALNYIGKDKITNNEVYTANVYSVAYNSLIQEFKLTFGKSNKLDSVCLSPNGKLLYVYQAPEHRVYNVRTGRLISRFNYDVKIAFANNDNFFVVSNGTTVTAYDSYTAEQLDNYLTASDNKIAELIVTEDDGYLVANTNRKQLVFWRIGIARPIRKFYGDDIVFNKEGNQFTITRLNGQQLNTFTYQLPEFKRIKKQSIDKILRDHARKQTLEIRKTNPSDKAAIIIPSKLIPEGFTLSNVGNYLAFFAQNSNEAKVLYIINTIDGKVLLEDVVGNGKQAVSVSWYNDSLLIPRNSLQAGVFNARQATFDQSLDLEIFNNASKIKTKKQVSQRLVSPDFEFTALSLNDKLSLKSNLNRFEQQDFEQLQGLVFSPNSKYFFFYDAVQLAYGYFMLNSLGLGKATYFSSQKRTFVEEQVKEERLPANWNYKQIKSFKHISSATAQDSLQLLMKTIEAGNKAGVQVQLIDKNGAYYYGASASDWKKIWCNLMVKGSDGKVRQIDDFTITEHRLSDTLPNAVAVAMDYSGSMGWAHADAVQDGVDKLIKAKGSNDLMALLKYDDKVQLECKPTSSSAKLLTKLYKSDYSFFGGATALLDAVNAGIYSIKNEENQGKKIVIAMTDGFENASLSTRNEVLANAVKNGVSIYTVAFGELVDNDYLKSLSYNTRGGHYQIFRTKDLDWIFKDIYNKANNYYTINYQSKDPGEQVYLLKLCLDTITTDSMVVQFNNSPADVKLLLANDYNYKENPVKTEGITKADLKGFDFPNLRDFSKVGSEAERGRAAVRIDEDQLTSIEDEFAKIQLPKFNFYYDEIKTVQETEIRIAEVVRFMNKYPNIRLAIIGHTDNSGSIAYNEELSLRRATIVRDMIVAKGIPSMRFDAKGYGETSPLIENNSEEGRAKNRRVEFVIVNEQ